MFKEVYKNAYDSKVPDYDFISKIEDVLETKVQKKAGIYIIQPVAAACLTCFLVTMIMGLTVVPVMAKEIPGVYRIIERYAPKLIEYILPEELGSSKAGVKMQVEAIQVEQKEAEIVISFTDEEGYDYINGKVDLYDSYRLNSFSGVSNVGGCSFLEYDEEADKAYYKVQLTTFDTFDSERMQLSVSMLLTENVEETKEISLADIDFEPKLKSVTLNGYGGIGDQEQIAKYFGVSDDFSYRHAAQVLDTGDRDEDLIDQLTITGIAYEDGILRVQYCRGNLTEADRVVLPHIVNENGTEQYDDFSFSWQEEIDGVRVSFDERWFLIEETELKNIRMYGDFYIHQGCLKGDWKVIFKVEED